MDTPQVTTVVKSKRELFTFSLAALGTLAAALGTLPVASADLPLPPEWRPYIISIGFFAVSLERVIKVIQGLWNRHTATLMTLFMFAGILSLSSCGITVTEDGCLLGNYKRGSSTYFAGPCVGTDSQVDRFRVQWENEDKQKLRATYWTKEKRPVFVEYFTGALWLKWTSKSGVLIGPVPPEVGKALEGNPEPIPAPVANPLNTPVIP